MLTKLWIRMIYFLKFKNVNFEISSIKHGATCHGLNQTFTSPTVLCGICRLQNAFRTHWHPQGPWMKFSINNFQANFSDWWLEYLFWNCIQMNGPYWWWVNVGSGNGLVPTGNKPLPNPDLCHHMVSLGHNELRAFEYKTSQHLIKKSFSIVWKWYLSVYAWNILCGISKGNLGNPPQNDLAIHWKMCILSSC